MSIIQVTHDTSLDNARSESSLAINPNNPQQIVGGSKKFINYHTYDFTLATSYSTDGGLHWNDSAAFALLPGWTGISRVISARPARERVSAVIFACTAAGVPCADTSPKTVQNIEPSLNCRLPYRWNVPRGSRLRNCRDTASVRNGGHLISRPEGSPSPRSRPGALPGRAGLGCRCSPAAGRAPANRKTRSESS